MPPSIPLTCHLQEYKSVRFQTTWKISRWNAFTLDGHADCWRDKTTQLITGTLPPTIICQKKKRSLFIYFFLLQSQNSAKISYHANQHSTYQDSLMARTILHRKLHHQRINFRWASPRFTVTLTNPSLYIYRLELLLE